MLDYVCGAQDVPQFHEIRLRQSERIIAVHIGSSSCLGRLVAFKWFPLCQFFMVPAVSVFNGSRCVRFSFKWFLLCPFQFSMVFNGFLMVPPGSSSGGPMGPPGGQWVPKGHGSTGPTLGSPWHPCCFLGPEGANI